MNELAPTRTVTIFSVGDAADCPTLDHRMLTTGLVNDIKVKLSDPGSVLEIPSKSGGEILIPVRHITGVYIEP